MVRNILLVLLTSELSQYLSIGWGQYLGQYLSLPVVNNAIAGRSARSYTDEGRFTSLINAAQKGDYVSKYWNVFVCLDDMLKLCSN